MTAIQVMATTPKGELTLRSDKVSKEFNINKAKKFLMKKVSDTYTVTEQFENPYRIIVSIKHAYENIINMYDVLEKTKRSVNKILVEHGATLSDVDIRILEDYHAE